MVAPIPLPNVPVLDVAIVGAGLCGLALARTLNTRGLNIQLFEARERLGGRILSAHCDTSQQMLDLGPTWFWSETEPRISALLGELGIPSQAQYDPGDALWLTDPNRQPERRSEPGGVHVGARCITGGAARLIQALAATLPPNGIHLGRAVTGLRDQGAYMELQTSNGSPIRARQVVLALPPRLIHEHLQFTPPLPSAVWEALTNAPTWMAAQAKSVTTFKQAFWRAAGHSGNAFVRHAQAVLAEVFDCSDSGSATHGGALGGFVALNAAQRESFQRGLPLLIDSQLAQLLDHKPRTGNCSCKTGPASAGHAAHVIEPAHQKPRSATPCCANLYGKGACFWEAARRRPTVWATWRERSNRLTASPMPSAAPMPGDTRPWPIHRRPRLQKRRKSHAARPWACLRPVSWNCAAWPQNATGCI